MLATTILNACASPLQSASTPSPTGAPPTNTPTEVSPSPTPTLTPFPIPKGPCDNILYPLLPGSEWVYRTSGSEEVSQMSLRVTDVENDLANIRMIDEQANVTTNDTVRCKDGAVINLPLVFISLLLSDYLDGVLNTYQESGITAPSLTTFEENNWQYSWEVEKLVEQPLKVELPDLGSGHILRNNIVKFESETIDVRESVTVPAGAFPQAIVVYINLRAPITVSNSGAIFIVKYKEWFEPFVGLVKIQTESASLDYAGLPVSILLDKTLELMEYKEGAP
jgi:hypothetical protein